MAASIDLAASSSRSIDANEKLKDAEEADDIETAKSKGADHALLPTALTERTQ